MPVRVLVRGRQRPVVRVQPVLGLEPQLVRVRQEQRSQSALTLQCQSALRSGLGPTDYPPVLRTACSRGALSQFPVRSGHSRAPY